MTTFQELKINPPSENKGGFIICKELYGLDTFKRSNYILNFLQENKISHRVNYSEDKNTKNISVFINNGVRETRVLCAHYDVVNKYNANDNTASLSILLSILRDNLSIIEDRYNYLFLFTDGEERGLTGAYHFTFNISEYCSGEIIEIINLELCGNGDTVLSDNKYGQYKVDFPGSDCIAFRKIFSNVTCLSLAPRELINNNQLINLWAKCHTKKDTLDNTNKESINYMYDYLIFILQHSVMNSKEKEI